MHLGDEHQIPPQEVARCRGVSRREPLPKLFRSTRGRRVAGDSRTRALGWPAQCCHRDPFDGILAARRCSRGRHSSRKTLLSRAFLCSSMVSYRFLPLGGTNVGAVCYLYELGRTRILMDCGVQPGLLAEKSLPRLELLKSTRPRRWSSPTPTATISARCRS